MGHALAPRLKPVHLVLAALAALAAIAVVTTLATLQRTAPTRVTGSRPAGAQLQMPTKISGTVVDDAPEAPAAQVSTPRRSSGQAGGGSGAGTAGQAPAVAGGGDTNVTIDNGSSDTETETGGSNVNNSAAVSARTGSGAEDGEP